MRKTRLWLGAAALASALTGCKTGELENKLDSMEDSASTGERYFRSELYSAADSNFARLASEPTPSTPLYQLDRIPCLIFQGKKKEAHELMCKLRTDLEELYDTESEKKALSKWHGEINKVFKGNPHEMAAFYALMALSFAERGEYEDAWRCVQNGLLHDCDSQDDKYKSDDALLLYLGTVFATKIGETDSAAQCRRRLAEALDARSLPGADIANWKNSAFAPILSENAPPPNALALLWTGTPPQYGRAGQHGEKRTILKGGDSAADFMTISIDDGNEIVIPINIGDINFQASTRGGRAMDNILANKAEFKQDMKNFQTASIGISGLCFAAALATFDTNETMFIISASLAAAGVAFLALDGVFYVFYDKTDPRADIRSWRTLPGQFSILPLHLPPGEHTIVARGYVGGDTFSSKSTKVIVPSGDGMSVFHIDGFDEKPLNDAVNLVGKIANICLAKAPKDVVAEYPDIGESWDTSVCYAITGTDPSSSRFRLNDVNMAFPLWKAMIRHKYLNHWSVTDVMRGRCPARPDKILMQATANWMITTTPEGEHFFDTRVGVCVRNAGTKAPGETSANSKNFETGPIKFFYAWSRSKTQKVNFSNVTTEEKQAGINAALDNLFKIREFREELSPHAVAHTSIPTAPENAAPENPAPENPTPENPTPENATPENATEVPPAPTPAPANNEQATTNETANE